MNQEYPLQRVFHGLVRGGGPRGDPDGDGALLEEVLGHHHLALDGAVLDGVVWQDAFRAVDVEGLHSEFVRDLLEVRRVGAVEAAHHQHEGQVLVGHQVRHGVLPLLRGVADGVELCVVLRQVCRAVLLQHGDLQQAADLLGLPLVHGGLVGQPDLGEVFVRVEAGRHGVLELAHELLLVAAVGDVVGHVLRLLHVLDDDVLLAEGRRGDGLLVAVLAVDHAGLAGGAVRVHGVPDLADPGTRGVHDLHLLLVQQLHLLDGGPEGRQDHHVAAVHHAVVLALLAVHELHVHLQQALVHLRVVYYLIRDVNGLVGEVGAGFVGHGDRSLHSPAKSVELGKFDCHIASCDDAAIRSQLGD
mmetsp:Transcript_19152/g.26372  ORF Transcript_19152/g.26372 Transcript_19152/m.26372 type:complete len:358 (-) Transcript_19152:291-1364(-)